MKKFAATIAAVLLTGAFVFADGIGISRAGGGVASLSVTAPITSTGGSTPTIGCTSAAASTAGCVSAGTQTMSGAKTFDTSVASPAYTSSAASGSNGFACTTDGCRMDFGTGSLDYLSSNGTFITAPGRFAVTDALEVPTDTGSIYLNGSSRSIGFGIRSSARIAVLGTLPVSPTTDQAINFGEPTVRWSNGYFGQLNVIAGTHATLMGVVPSVLNVNTTSVASATAGPNDLITYSLLGNALSANGKGLRITAWGTTTNNANAKTVTCNFGGTAIITTALTISQAGTWRVVGEVIRTGAATQISTATLTQGGTTTILDVETGAPGETLSGAVTVKCTATNEITQLGLIVEEFN